ncbi:hypothetical protein MKW92_046656, partial [Papaver armeniacum]
ASELLRRNESRGDDVHVSLQYNKESDKRRYNLPTAYEIDVILPEDGQTINSGARDIILHLKGSRALQRINECNPAYLPLHYVLLFLYGELGWEPGMRHWDIDLDKATDTRLT